MMVGRQEGSLLASLVAISGGSVGVHLRSDGHLQQCEAATEMRIGARSGKAMLS